MKILKQIQNNTIIQFALAFVCLVLFAVSSSFFVLTKNNLFPILNFAILILSFFIKKGEYRIFSLAFFAPLFKCFNLYNSSFTSSFYTIGIIFYEVLVVLELVIKKRQIDLLNGINRFKIAVIFCCYALLISFVSATSFKSILQSFSSVFYFLLPFFCMIDPTGQKNKYIILLFSFGILFANLFSFSFLYIIKSKGVLFLELFMPSYIKAYTLYSGTFFRFGGLRGDSNGNSLYILLASSLLLTMVKWKNKKSAILMIVLIIVLQPFAILGGSKTYYLGLVLSILVYFIYKFSNSKIFPVIILITAFIFFLVFIIGHNFFYPFLRRLLMTDTRQGFLSGITTERSDILVNYLRAILNDPIRFLFGHGARSQLLNNTDFHNTIIQIIWDFGIIGFILFIFSYLRFYIEALAKNRLTIISLIIFVLYLFSLHMLYHEGIYIVFICLAFVPGEEKLTFKEKRNEKVQEYAIKI